MIYSPPVRTLARCTGRYPTESEEQEFLDFADAMPKRLQVANLLAQKEAEIVRAAVDEMRVQYPRFAPQHDRAWDKAGRDMGLVLRYAAQGMIVADAEMPKDKLFVWLGTIVRGTGHTPAFFRDCYTAVVSACRRVLPPDSFAVAESHLQRMLDDMSSFPDPLKPAVD